MRNTLPLLSWLKRHNIRGVGGALFRRNLPFESSLESEKPSPKELNHPVQARRGIFVPPTGEVSVNVELNATKTLSLLWRGAFNSAPENPYALCLKFSGIAPTEL